MNTTQLQGLIGTLVVLGVLALVALPALIGVLHDRRVDRQLREAAKRQAAIDGSRPERRASGSMSRRFARTV
ncbi:hypothetical protein [Streptomyces ossamyceticus]|uniref:hypothetical protein n=1 Tax=Streptomyces ossamyceticus TaxID=249581 RepID=UPI0006E37C37|nr:hypothetical protein [Streptomyces ossamyceticus]